jgi:endonuclease/exonuclease/phosphatase (EEP) superfamily protein YafD
VRRSLVCVIVACVSLSTIIGIVILHSLVYNAAEWHFARILLIIFQVGVALTCMEVAKWWKARMMQLRPPPLANLITYRRDRERGWQATHMFGFPLSPPHVIPEWLQHPVQNVEDDQEKKVA